MSRHERHGSAWLASLVPLALVACAGATKSAAQAAPVTPRHEEAFAWQTTSGRTHPLVGRIWDARARAFVEAKRVFEGAAQARFVLLGEKHDNPDHHRLQALVLEREVEAGRRPRVAFEMLEVGEQPTVDAYWATPGATASGFGAAVGWNESGWPPFHDYEPILDVAFAARLPILAANLEHERARALVHEGLSALSPERVALLELDRPFPPELERSLEADLGADHCGMLPQSILAPMALAQHARDAQMARALQGGEKDVPATLIAGGGHVRRDRGVPYYLALNGETSLLALDFVEVQADQTEPSRYVPAAPDGTPAVDFVWFTPRANDEDPCKAFTHASGRTAVSQHRGQVPAVTSESAAQDEARDGQKPDDARSDERPDGVRPRLAVAFE